SVFIFVLSVARTTISQPFARLYDAPFANSVGGSAKLMERCAKGKPTLQKCKVGCANNGFFRN
ncbi:MAG: hypothetical protein ACTHLW_05795, partial [Verrucomicrobiota bacterium]